MPATSSSLNRRGFLASSAAVGAFATCLPAVMGRPLHNPLLPTAATESRP